MKKKDILLFTISLLFFSLIGNTQNNKEKDSVTIKKIYGIRVGLDLSNPIRYVLNSNRKAFEITADYRINKKLFIAAETGFLDQFTEELKYDFQTKGQYIKVGVNYNVYKNWLDMDNEIYLGIRYGYSTFSQIVSNVVIDDTDVLPNLEIPNPIEYSGLNANWVELIVGIKAEITKNVFLGFQFSNNLMLFQKESNSFSNLYIPGFNRVFLNKSGVGFNYTISYRIPLKQK